MDQASVTAKSTTNIKSKNNCQTAIVNRQR